jgi:hypothetical protein
MNIIMNVNVNIVVILIVLFGLSAQAQGVHLYKNRIATIMFTYEIDNNFRDSNMYFEKNESVFLDNDSFTLGYCALLNSRLETDFLIDSCILSQAKYIKKIINKYSCGSIDIRNTAHFEDTSIATKHGIIKFGGDVYSNQVHRSAIILAYHVKGDFLMLELPVTKYLYPAFVHCGVIKKGSNAIIIPMRIEEYFPLTTAERNSLGFSPNSMRTFKYIMCD